MLFFEMRTFFLQLERFGFLELLVETELVTHLLNVRGEVVAIVDLVR